jgi:hypothetical protein
MRQHLTRPTLGIAILVVAAAWTAAPVGGQTSTTYKAARTATGQPDISGFWQALNTANWDLEAHGVAPSPFPELMCAYFAQPAGLSVVEGGTIPYRPEALEKRNRFRANRLKTDPLLLDNEAEDTADPEAKCFQGGVPRVTYLGFPFQIIQSNRDVILMAYEFAGTGRPITMGTDLAKTRTDKLLNIDTWMGQAVGKWEGETLVVDTRWFSGPSVWLDRSGNFYSSDAVITERYTAISPHHLMYEATIEDPSVFTRPWKLSMPLYRRIEPNMQLLEFQCIPLAEKFMYGSVSKPGVPFEIQLPR